MSLSRRKFVHDGISALFPHTGFQHRLMTPTLRYRKPFSQVVKKAATPPKYKCNEKCANNAAKHSSFLSSLVK